jgi:hypothetical protein
MPFFKGMTQNIFTNSDEQTERDDRLIWSVSEYFSSWGKAAVILKISMAQSNAF